MKKYIGYILAILFLLSTILIIWYLFFCLNLVESKDKMLAGVIGSLGISFGVFQFWINIVISKQRKLFDLRYSEYKDYINNIDSISAILNNEMTYTNPIDVHGLVSTLMTQINRFRSSITINKDYLFSGIDKTPEAQKVKVILDKILTRSDKFRVGIENAQVEEKVVAKDFLESIEKMNWHNEIRKHLGELNDAKNEFYKVLRKHL